MSDQWPSPFTRSSARRAMEIACARVGVDPAEAEPLRFGQNALYLLDTDGIVARVARSLDMLDVVRTELAVAGWLAAADFPARRAVPIDGQPVIAEGRPVSFWRWIPEEGPRPRPDDLGRLLRRLHSLSLSNFDPVLPELEPLRQVRPRLDAAAGVAEDDLDFLRRRCAELEAAYAELTWALPPGPVHGDAHIGNLIARPHGPVLIDFEGFATGPREWDLMPTSIARLRFGLSSAEYAAFCRAYDFDVMTWRGYPLLRQIRELTMTTWLMQNIGESQEAAKEFAARLDSLREGEPPVPGDPSEPPFDPPARRGALRITNVYATSGDDGAEHAARDAVSGYLRLGRLGSFYDSCQAQLPAVVAREQVPVGHLAFERWRDAAELRAACCWVFRLPTGQLVTALTLDVCCSVVSCIDLMEDCYYGSIHVSGGALETHLLAFLQRTARGRAPAGLAGECHQLVYATPEAVSPHDDDVLQRLVYRTDLPYRPQHSTIAYPPELNRRPDAAAAVGPYVSVLVGQQDYLENCVLLCAVQAVGAAARLRSIRESAYAAVRSFRETTSTPGLPERRKTLERLADRLGGLELDLSYEVEAGADLGLLVPSLRVDSFHRTIYERMELLRRAGTVSRMLDRLERSIAAELTTVDSVDRRVDDQRRMRWTVMVGFVSTVAVPLTLVFGFFGVNATQVDDGLSMFDPRYLWMYTGIGAILLVGVVLFLLLSVQAWRLQRRP